MNHTYRPATRPTAAELLRVGFRLLALLAIAAIAASALLIVAALAAEHPNEPIVTLAGQGQTDAQFILGNSYWIGQGVPQDVIKAHAWLPLAAAQGDKQAIRDRNR